MNEEYFQKKKNEIGRAYSHGLEEWIIPFIHQIAVDQKKADVRAIEQLIERCGYCEIPTVDEIMDAIRVAEIGDDQQPKVIEPEKTDE